MTSVSMFMVIILSYVTGKSFLSSGFITGVSWREKAQKFPLCSGSHRITNDVPISFQMQAN